MISRVNAGVPEAEKDTYVMYSRKRVLSLKMISFVGRLVDLFCCWFPC